MSSLTKKYLMAASGLVLVGFVLVHMLGNLQFFGGPEVINRYAHKIRSLPAAVLWGFRGFLLLSAIVHVVTAILLTKENRAARPQSYRIRSNVQASYASRTMPMSGLILLSFIIFHLLHYTFRIFPHTDTFGPAIIEAEGKLVEVFDIHAMMVAGFSNVWISLFYLISMGLLCLHLSHGVSSLFQSLGLRNGRWRKILNRVAISYGWLIFLGFISIPLAVLTKIGTG